MHLADAGIEKVAGTMTYGQMFGIFFMLMIPFFFRRFDGPDWGYAAPAVRRYVRRERMARCVIG